MLSCKVLKQGLNNIEANTLLTQFSDPNVKPQKHNIFKHPQS